MGGGGQYVMYGGYWGICEMFENISTTIRRGGLIHSLGGGGRVGLRGAE